MATSTTLFAMPMAASPTQRYSRFGTIPRTARARPNAGNAQASARRLEIFGTRYPPSCSPATAAASRLTNATASSPFVRPRSSLNAGMRAAQVPNTAPVKKNIAPVAKNDSRTRSGRMRSRRRTRRAIDSARAAATTASSVGWLIRSPR
jgi:hypothetical protein